MENVQNLIDEIKSNLTQKSSSRKDEVRVMKAMLNDTTYKVDVYDKSGKCGEYCPAESAKQLVASVLQNSAGISNTEADALAKGYEFSSQDAENMIGISKEFVNTYVHTGRKIAMGGREKSNISLELKEVEATSRPYPKVVGIDSNGKKIYGRGMSKIGAYEGLKVNAPCPAWISEE
jgi:hypothetical protein